jgi:RNA polymerase sigma factor (sigma-70 family)
MYNPFRKNDDNENNVLVTKTLGGDAQALDELIHRHQAWIYNIALRMVFDPHDAQDVTQEILIKIITKLSTYDSGKAAFRTWLYHIVANHVLDMKKKNYECVFTGFEDYYNTAQFPDENPETYPGYNMLIEESEIACYVGSLLCFDRKQRLVFILGAIFNVDDTLGSEIIGISKSNFRQILSRSRKKLYNFVSHNCGLLDDKNPCHCSTKLLGHIKAGWLRPHNIMFCRGETQTVNEVIDLAHFRKSYLDKPIQLFRRHPFYQDQDFTSWVRKTIETDKFKKLFHLC